jgi:hypothetical protein
MWSCASLKPGTNDAAADIDDTSARAGEPTKVCRRPYGNDALASNGDGLGPWARGVTREDLAAKQDEVRRLLTRPGGLRRKGDRERGGEPAAD